MRNNRKGIAQIEMNLFIYPMYLSYSDYMYALVIR